MKKFVMALILMSMLAMPANACDCGKVVVRVKRPRPILQWIHWRLCPRKRILRKCDITVTIKKTTVRHCTNGRCHK